MIRVTLFHNTNSPQVIDVETNGKFAAVESAASGYAIREIVLHDCGGSEWAGFFTLVNRSLITVKVEKL